MASRVGQPTPPTENRPEFLVLKTLAYGARAMSARINLSLKSPLQTSLASHKPSKPPSCDNQTLHSTGVFL